MLASDLLPLKAIAGLLIFPISELFDLGAIAVVGRPGLRYVKKLVFGLFKRFILPKQAAVASDIDPDNSASSQSRQYILPLRRLESYAHIEGQRPAA